MNKHLQHIKRSSSPLAVLTLLLLLAALQSPAQHHGKGRPRHHARHTGGMPDSVTTTDDEIRPFSPETETAKVDTTTVSQSTDTIVRQEDLTSTVSPPDSEEKEPPLVLRRVPDSVIHHRQKERDFAYANDPSWWKDKPEVRNNNSERSFQGLFDSKWFRWFIYMFLAAVLLYALYRIIAENNLRFFYRKPTMGVEKPLAEAELPEEDLDQLLKKALDEKAHRMATRLFYLKTLRMLETRQLIRWNIRTTDEEYARQLDNSPQGGNFRWLMSAYERVWYGKFPLNEEQFSRLFQYFRDFQTSIDHSRRA